MPVTSDAGIQPQVSLLLPQQASPPIPAAGTVDACAVYFDGTDLMASKDGGAYAAIGGGGGGSLDAAYLLGNTISLTNAAGAVVLSSARTSGNILTITQTALAAATMTGIAIDLSAAGTFANQATVDIPAITIVGARSTVAKATGAALVQISSAYRNASALSISTKNKQATVGSIVQIGWSSTNYEGAVASTTLTGQTHVLTIDGQTNVTAGAQEFVGIRILVPSSSHADTKSLYVGTLQTAGRIFDMAFNAATTLTATFIGMLLDLNTNVTPGAVHVNGFVTTTPATTAADAASSVTAAGVLSALGSGALYVYARSTLARTVEILTQQESGPIVHVGYPTGRTVTLSGTLYGEQIDLQTNVTAGAAVVIGSAITIPASSNTGTFGVRLYTAQTAGVLYFAGFNQTTTLSSSIIGHQINLTSNVTPGAQSVIGCYVTLPASTHTSSRGFAVVSTQRGGSGVEVTITPASSATVTGQTIAMGANSTGTSTDGGALRIADASTSTVADFRTMSIVTSGANHIALALHNTATGANPSGAYVQVIADGYTEAFVPISTSGTHLAWVLGVYRAFNFTNTGSITLPMVQFSNRPYCTGGTLTVATSTLKVAIDTAGSTSTMNISGPVLELVNAAANTTTNTSPLITGTTNAQSGLVVGVTATGTLTGTMTMLTLNASGVTAGAQECSGIDISIPATSNGSSKAITMTVVSAGLGASGVEMFMSPNTSSATVLGIDMTMSANCGDGSFGWRMTNNGTGPGFVITHSSTATSASLSNLNIITEGGAVTGTRNTRVLAVSRSNSFAGSGTYDLDVMTVYNAPSVSAGTLTHDHDVFTVQSAPSQSGGTLNISGSVVSVSHAPTGTVASDTSIGVEIVMTPAASAAVTGQLITMGSNATGIALSLAASGTIATSMLQVAHANAGVFTSTAGLLARFDFGGSGALTGTDSCVLVRINNGKGSSSAWTTTGDMLKLTNESFMSTGGTVAYTYSGNLLNLQMTPNNAGGTNTFAVSGTVANINYAPTASGGTPTFTETITGLKVTMTPYSANAVVGVSVNMSSANAQGAALTIAHSGTNANQIVFTSAADGTGSHIYGPTTADLYLRAGIAAQTTTTTAGRGALLYGSNAVAGSSVAGAAAGGYVALVGGDAARLTSGNADGGVIELSPGTGIGTGVTGGVLVGVKSPTFMEMYEMTAPAAGAANTGRLFLVDSGAGKTILKIQFASGAAQTIATEP